MIILDVYCTFCFAFYFLFLYGECIRVEYNPEIGSDVFGQNAGFPATQISGTIQDGIKSFVDNGFYNQITSPTEVISKSIIAGGAYYTNNIDGNFNTSYWILNGSVLALYSKESRKIKMYDLQDLQHFEDLGESDFNGINCECAPNGFSLLCTNRAYIWSLSTLALEPQQILTYEGTFICFSSDSKYFLTYIPTNSVFKLYNYTSNHYNTYYSSL